MDNWGIAKQVWLHAVGRFTRISSFLLHILSASLIRRSGSDASVYAIRFLRILKQTWFCGGALVRRSNTRAAVGCRALINNLNAQLRRRLWLRLRRPRNTLLTWPRARSEARQLGVLNLTRH